MSLSMPVELLDRAVFRRSKVSRILGSRVLVLAVRLQGGSYLPGHTARSDKQILFAVL